MALVRLSTTAEVMRELGGIRPVAALTGTDWKNVENWSRAERFPARYFLVMWLELVSRGFHAPPDLWGQALSRNKEALLTIMARKARAAA
jgi:hypothetical protein